MTKDYKLSAAIIVINWINSKAPTIGAISRSSFKITYYKKFASNASVYINIIYYFFFIY